MIVACVCSSRPAYDRSGGQIEEDLIEEAAAALAQLERELAPESVAISYRQPEGTSAARGARAAASRLDRGPPDARRAVSDRRDPDGLAARGSVATIGVAYIDTPEGREALRGAHALARRVGATLRVLTVAKST